MNIKNLKSREKMIPSAELVMEVVLTGCGIDGGFLMCVNRKVGGCDPSDECVVRQAPYTFYEVQCGIISLGRRIRSRKRQEEYESFYQQIVKAKTLPLYLRVECEK
jgi:hypothetical protein